MGGCNKFMHAWRNQTLTQNKLSDLKFSILIQEVKNLEMIMQDTSNVYIENTNF